MAKATVSKRTVTVAQKKAMANGREESRMVRSYLDAIETPKRRGRQRTPDGIKRRLATIERQLDSASTIQRLHLLQEQSDLADELRSKQTPLQDVEKLRANFIKVAKSYGDRKGISYATWRAVGVDAATLKAAGITR